MTDPLFLRDPNAPAPALLSFHNTEDGKNDLIVALWKDGRAEFGPGFTTQDAESRLFWERIGNAYPRLLWPELTPAMIQAGSDAIRKFDYDLWETKGSPEWMTGILTAVYTAMREKAR